MSSINYYKKLLVFKQLKKSVNSLANNCGGLIKFTTANSTIQCQIDLTNGDCGRKLHLVIRNAASLHSYQLTNATSQTINNITLSEGHIDCLIMSTANEQLLLYATTRTVIDVDMDIVNSMYLFVANPPKNQTKNIYIADKQTDSQQDVLYETPIHNKENLYKSSEHNEVQIATEYETVKKQEVIFEIKENTDLYQATITTDQDDENISVFDEKFDQSNENKIIFDEQLNSQQETLCEIPVNNRKSVCEVDDQRKIKNETECEEKNHKLIFEEVRYSDTNSEVSSEIENSKSETEKSQHQQEIEFIQQVFSQVEKSQQPLSNNLDNQIPQDFSHERQPKSIFNSVELCDPPPFSQTPDEIKSQQTIFSQSVQDSITEYEKFIQQCDNYYNRERIASQPFDINIFRSDTYGRFKSVEEYSNAFEQYYAGDKSGNYYQTIKQSLQQIFDAFSPYTPLMESIPSSYWVKVDNNRTNFFLIGLITKDENPYAIGYALPANQYNSVDDKDFIYKKFSGDDSRCYYILFQDCITGGLINEDNLNLN